MLRCIALSAMASVCLTTVAEAHDFSWDTLLVAKMKLQRGFDYESHVDAYMQVFRSNVWNRYKNDEFELQDRRNETLKLMKGRVDSFDLNEDVTINATFSIGKYDFDKEEFPVIEATSDHYWYQSRYSVREFPSRFRVYFANPDRISRLPMPKDVARQFLQRRKDRYGNVSRRITIALRVRLLKMKNARDEFLVDIRSAQFFDDQGRTRLIHEVVPPKPVTDKLSQRKVNELDKSGKLSAINDKVGS